MPCALRKKPLVKEVINKNSGNKDNNNDNIVIDNNDLKKKDENSKCNC